MTNARECLNRIATNLAKVMRGQDRSIRLLLAAFAGGGHVLLEDVPGTGKTTLAKALAKSVDLKFQRIQFTPDLLPSDVLGVSIFDQRDHKFHFHQGPVFTDILLADEINRASPRTQSALLEAMAEGQVSVERNRYKLKDHFFVIATQNPVEFHGTYPLPEAQMDRFAMRFKIGYVSPEQEVAILSDQQERHPLDEVEAVTNRDELNAVRAKARTIRISEELKRYIVDIVAATRTAEDVQLGAGPRASLALMKTSQALALFDGHEFVTPDHIQDLAVPVVAHRLAVNPQAKFSGTNSEAIVKDIVEKLDVPL